jgi:hypothetical protein
VSAAPQALHAGPTKGWPKVLAYARGVPGRGDTDVIVTFERPPTAEEMSALYRALSGQAQQEKKDA